MHDPHPPPGPEGPALTGAAKMALVVYILYILGLVTFGLVTIVGLVIAYINRGEARGTWVESHFRWQIRTFWIGLLYSLIAAVTLVIGIGMFVQLLVLVWLIVRVALGWSHLAKDRAVPNPTSWFF